MRILAIPHLSDRVFRAGTLITQQRGNALHEEASACAGGTQHDFLSL